MMADLRQQIILSKKELVQALGEKEKEYWTNMKAWFKHSVTKEEFDMEARRLLPKEDTHLHNKFLLAVLTKCHMPSSAGGSKEASAQAANKNKKNKRLQAVKRKYENRFIGNEPNITPPIVQNLKLQRVPPISLQQPIEMCSKSLLIPTKEEMNGYVSVISWEMGLDDVADEVIILATDAVQIFLKNLLSAIFSRRSAYKTYSKTFKYAMGCEPENPYLFTQMPLEVATVGPTYEEAEQREIEKLGRTSQRSYINKAPVNMFDLLHTLQVSRSVIPSHTVHSFATERVIAGMWHPSHEELEQDHVISTLMHSN